jgi:RimJ/RimL family protein N-acetyltransferase
MIIANEKFADCSTECAIFGAMHWQELFGKKRFRANWKAVEALEKANQFAYFTMRDDDGKLCGHVGYRITECPFFGCFTAIDTFFYILPEHRGTHEISDLLRFAANYLQACGIEDVFAAHLVVNKKLPAAMERAGYGLVSKMYRFEE